MTAPKSKTPPTENPHVEAAQRIRQLTQILLVSPAAAKAFHAQTGVFTAAGELKASYR